MKVEAKNTENKTNLKNLANGVPFWWNDKLYMKVCCSNKCCKKNNVICLSDGVLMNWSLDDVNMAKVKIVNE